MSVIEVFQPLAKELSYDHAIQETARLLNMCPSEVHRIIQEKSIQ